MRQVRGVLFVDYVRMLRSQKAVDWSLHLAPEDLPYLQMHIDPGRWYPMATFERMGNAILETVTRGELFPVQLWGRYSAAQLRAANPMLLAPNDPPETVTRGELFPVQLWGRYSAAQLRAANPMLLAPN